MQLHLSQRRPPPGATADATVRQKHPVVSSTVMSYDSRLERPKLDDKNNCVQFISVCPKARKQPGSTSCGCQTPASVRQFSKCVRIAPYDLQLKIIARHSATALVVLLGQVCGLCEKASDLAPACPSRKASDRKERQAKEEAELPTHVLKHHFLQFQLLLPLLLLLRLLLLQLLLMLRLLI